MKFCMGCMEQYEDGAELCPHCGYVENTPPATPLQMVPGSILADRYIVGKSIGSGGFGVTYIGWDAVLETKVAIKEYLPSEFSTRAYGKTEITVFEGDKQEQFTSGMTRFIDEAKRLAKFSHVKGIVHIFDSFEVNNTAYIIMELLEGETLAQRLERDNTIPQDEAVKMLLPVMRSLGEVHRAGIIHRDIAPDNIFVTNEGNIKLIDFGAARFATTTHSRSLSVLVKPGYSPEEQYESRGEQGPHTDVYSLAATMYRMITGKCPPTSIERMAKVRNRKKDPLAPIAKFVPDIDENYETAIMNALNVRINDRTETMEKFAEELTSETTVKRRASNISTIINLRWPLWAKIGVPVAAAALVTFGVLFATGVVGFNANLKKDIVIPEGQTRVPSVINEEYNVGKEKLEEANLLIEIQDKRDNEFIAENLILTQDVNGGAIVRENMLVGVTVSAGITKQVVPDITGMELKEAKEQLEFLGFVVSSEEKYDNTIAKGCIISQSLNANEEVKVGSEIVLTVSKGRDSSAKEKEVRLPNFIGMKYSEALQLAKELDITIKVTERKYSKGYEKDVIMEQALKANTTIKNTTIVGIVLSLGYDKVEIPDVTLMTEENAVRQLSSRGLRANITYKNDETIAAGLIISQSPKGKSEVDAESAVELVVSKGASAFAMPDVIGMKEAQARETLNGKGLAVDVNYEQDDSKSEGEVLFQSISAGANVLRGETIIITVCTHSNIITVPYVIGMSQSSAESSIRSAGLKPNVVTLYSSTVSKGAVISQSPVGGSGLHKGDMVTISVSLGKDENTTDAPSSTVTPAPVEPPSEAVSIRLDKTSVTMTEGDTQKLSYYTDSSKWTMTLSQDWKSSNTSVVSVDGNGTITAKRAGTATVTINATGKTATGKTVTASDTCTITVNAIIVPTDITLSNSNLTMDISETKLLTATVSPSNAKEKSVTWSSSNTSVVTVDNGFIEAVSDGTATITAKTVNGKTASCTVKVNEIVPTAITLNSNDVTVTVGDTKQLTAAIFPTNAKNKTITWSSDDTAVVTVNSSGLLSAKAEGTATITAKTSNNITVTCAVKVVSIVPASISIDRSSDNLYIGDTRTLSAMVLPANAKDKSVTWKSSNTSVATVSNGKVTATGAGSATITAQTYNGKTANYSVNVTKPAIKLSKTSISLYVDDTETITASTTPTGQSVTWTSSNTSVAVVSSGKVTATGAGTAKITAEFTYRGNTYSATCDVTVKKPSITLNPTSKTVYSRDEFTITATTSPGGQTVTWSSSNSSVASVSNGKVTTKASGISINTATITAEFIYQGTTYSATCAVTVNPIDLDLDISGMPESVYVGDVFTIPATTSPSGQTVTWSTSNSSVASVSNGKVTANAKGTATITATMTYHGYGCESVFNVTVNKPSITLNSTSKTVYFGDEFTITAATSPSGQPVTWSTSNSSVASVSNGKVTAHGHEGTATITAKFTYNGATYSETCAVTVKNLVEESPGIRGSGTKNVYDGQYRYDVGAIGYYVSLPTVTCAPGCSVSWSVISGSAEIVNSQLFIMQPGTVKVRWKVSKNGYSVSADYSYTLSIYKTTTAPNTFYKYNHNSPYSFDVPGNTTVYFKEIVLNGKYGESGSSIYGKTTYAGESGWIIISKW